MATTPGNVLIGSGTLSAYIDPAGSTSYAWTSMGGFRDGISINFSEDRVNIESQDSLGFVKSARTRMECTITTSLLESTFDNFNTLWYGNGLVSTANINLSTVPGNERSSVPIKFVGDSTDGDLKTIIFSAAVPVMDGELTFSKDAELLIPATFMALSVDTTGAGAWGFGDIANT